MTSLALEPRVAVPRPVASARHAAVLVAILLLVALAGAASRPATHATAGRAAAALPVYASVLAMEWGLVWYVWRGGLRRTGTSIAALVRPAHSPAGVARDLALGLGAWGALWLLSSAWSAVTGERPDAVVTALMPRGAIESAAWVAVSLSAGFCEELVFRGYLQRQLHAWTGRGWLAVVLQAAVFGVAHGYQGVLPCAKIALIGLLFGALAWRRGGLVPGMFAHALVDVLAGLARI